MNRHLDSNDNVKVPSYVRGQFLQPWRAIHCAASWQGEGSQNEDFTSEVVSTFWRMKWYLIQYKGNEDIHQIQYAETLLSKGNWEIEEYICLARLRSETEST